MTNLETLASEYVLGTLDAVKRKEADTLLAENGVFQDLVAAWSEHLSPMAEAVTPVTPPAAVFAGIEARLGRDNKAMPVGIHAVNNGEGYWRDISSGVQIKSLYINEDENTECFLLKFAPGGRITEHQHADWDDECIMMEGEIMMGDTRLCAGDFHVAKKGSTHPALHSISGGTIYVRSTRVTGVPA